MNDIFKEYGVAQKSIQEIIEDFGVALITEMCNPPKKIVFDKHTYNRFVVEISRKLVKNDDANVFPTEVVEQAKSIIRQSTTVSGQIEIVCED